MRIRGYEEDDRRGLGRLLSLVFGGTEAEGEEALDPEKNSRLDPEQVYVAVEDGAPRATATVLPMEAFVDGRAAPMGGVAAVATHPAYRRKHFAGELMRAALRGMRERGVHLSMLDPFAHSFYRAHGYELAAEAIRYGLKPGELPTSPEQAHIRARREEDLPRMRELLEGEARRHQICVRRGEGRWRQLESLDGGDGRESVAYERDGKIEGYLLYSQKKPGGASEHRLLQASEMISATPRAREAMISFMASYDPRDWRIDYAVPRGEPLHPHLGDSHVEAKIRPGMMLRLLDVEGALSYLDRPIDRPLVLEVSDDSIPGNAGAYTVGEGNVVRGAAAPEKAALDVRQLAQLYAGYLTVDQLYRRGLISPGSDRALESLKAIFPAGDPWVFPLDHF